MDYEDKAQAYLIQEQRLKWLALSKALHRLGKYLHASDTHAPLKEKSLQGGVMILLRKSFKIIGLLGIRGPGKEDF